MNQSEDIKELAKALNKFQASVGAVKKGAKNPFFKSNYATLDAIQKAMAPVLEETGLSYSQSHTAADGAYSMTTRILHTSGQWIETNVPAPITKNDPQGVGSANTYAKRYGLTQAFGIPVTDEDDDGNYASGRVQPQNKQPPIQKHTWGLVTEPQIKRMYAIIHERQDAGWTLGNAKKLMHAHWGHESSKALTKSQYDTLTNWIQSSDWKDHEQSVKSKR